MDRSRPRAKPTTNARATRNAPTKKADKPVAARAESPRKKTGAQSAKSALQATKAPATKAPRTRSTGAASKSAPVEATKKRSARSFDPVEALDALLRVKREHDRLKSEKGDARTSNKVPSQKAKAAAEAVPAPKKDKKAKNDDEGKKDKKAKKDKKEKKAKKDKSEKKKRSLADKADKYDLYQRSVQNADYEVGLLRKVYRDAYGKDREPKILREDFGGTAAVCCEWVRRDKDRLAFGVDIDPEPIAWGKANNLSQLKSSEQARVTYVEGDVRDGNTPKADIVAGMNFSYFIFKTRDDLRAYFKAAYNNLKDEGVLALDMFGGHEVFEDSRVEIHRIEDFRYCWDQHDFDPITGHYTFFIHFAFKDKSKLKQAFRYDWRMWSIPEVRELLLEAGFQRADVYWEDTDKKTGEGNGNYRIRARGDADPAWLAYIVAVK